MSDTVAVVEPATEQVMAELPRAGADEVDRAVTEAAGAFPAWRAIAPAERAGLLHLAHRHVLAIPPPA